MHAEEEPHATAKRSERSSDPTSESDEETEGERRTDRDKRWTDAKADHWHTIDYTDETQARSETEDHT